MRGETIQHFIDMGDSYDIYCHKPLCGNRGKVDMLKLRDRLGPDHGCLHDDIIHLFYCTRCGGKRVGLIRRTNIERLDRERMERGNLYAKAKGG